MHPFASPLPSAVRASSRATLAWIAVSLPLPASADLPGGAVAGVSSLPPAAPPSPSRAPASAFPLVDAEIDSRA